LCKRFGHGVVPTAMRHGKSSIGRSVRNGVATTTTMVSVAISQCSRRGLRAYRAGWALLAEQTQPQGPHTLAEVCRFPPEGTCAPQTQDHAQHLAVPGTAKVCAKRGVACLVSQGRKLRATQH